MRILNDQKDSFGSDSIYCIILQYDVRSRLSATLQYFPGEMFAVEPFHRCVVVVEGIVSV